MNPLASDADKSNALEVINNWRASHQYPLNLISDALRKKAKKLTPKGNVVQRIKRLRAIEEKLDRETIKLNQMQDIGGCRVIVSTIGQVNALLKSYSKKGGAVKITNYIEKPRDTGYRGVHIIHEFCSKQYPQYNNLKIEMQLRTQKQHIWATGVETVGYYINQPLKANKGDQDWLRFFQLLSSAIALQEGTPLVKGTPKTRIQILVEFLEVINRIDAVSSIMMYGRAAKILGDPKNTRGASHFLIELNTKKKEMNVKAYKEKDISLAQKNYEEAEKNKLDGVNVVLASASSYAALKRAYPNYFLNTEKFLTLLKDTLIFLSGKDFSELLGDKKKPKTKH